MLLAELDKVSKQPFSTYLLVSVKVLCLCVFAEHVIFLRNRAASTSSFWLYSTFHMFHRLTDGMCKHTYSTSVLFVTEHTDAHSHELESEELV